MQKLKTKEVLSRTKNLCISRISLFIVGALFFGLLSSGSTLYVENYVAAPIHEIMTKLKTNGGQLGRLLSGLDDGNIDQLFTLIQDVQNGSTLGLEAMSLLSSVMAPMLQVVLWSVGLSLLVSFLASIYYLQCCKPKKQSIGSALLHSITCIPGMIAIVAWSSVCSFSWIPVIGLLIGVIIFPRLMFAPIALVIDDTRSFSCVNESFKRTKGAWWYVSTILSNVSLIVLFVGLITIFFSSIVLDPYLGKYSVILRSFIWQGTLAFTVVSLVVMWTAEEGVEVLEGVEGVEMRDPQTATVV